MREYQFAFLSFDVTGTSDIFTISFVITDNPMSSYERVLFGRIDTRWFDLVL